MYEYQLAHVWEQYYDFTDDRGERHSGTTTKVLVLTYKDGHCVRSDVYKAASGYAPTACDTFYTGLLYDKFGRLAGVTAPPVF